MTDLANNAFRQILIDATNVFAIVGDNIFKDTASQCEDVPFVVFHLVANRPYRGLGGRSGMTVKTYQLNCYAPTETLAADLEDECRLALDDFKGNVTIPLESGNQIMRVHRLNRTDTNSPLVPIQDASSYPIRRYAQDYTLTHYEG